MSKKIFFALISTFVFFSACSPSKSWLYTAESTTAIYEDPGLTKKIITVPAGQQVFVEQVNPWGLVSYGKILGYTDLAEFRKRKSITKRQLRRLHFAADSVNVFTDNKSHEPEYKPSPVDHPSATQTGTSQTRPTGGYKPVSVKGYTRKDGTYVKPHTRSAPRRR